MATDEYRYYVEDGEVSGTSQEVQLDLLCCGDGVMHVN